VECPTQCRNNYGAKDAKVFGEHGNLPSRTSIPVGIDRFESIET
jgi:hypothetical protein